MSSFSPVPPRSLSSPPLTHDRKSQLKTTNDFHTGPFRATFPPCVVEIRHHLPDIPRLLFRLQRRWDRRSQRHPCQVGLSQKPRRRHPLALPHLSLPTGGYGVRHVCGPFSSSLVVLMSRASLTHLPASSGGLLSDLILIIHSSDYRDIDPRYGTLADWDKLLQGVHRRGMKLMYVTPRSLTCHIEIHIQMESVLIPFRGVPLFAQDGPCRQPHV